ncbi:aldehyde dehydrogenase family protein [Embleya hyalina]|uniref:Aldehyde dehydrogenase n=1 Tax=Embleya hyalina TaxID=516124 RepID=A0A401YQX5_9ACTN|nr:aldehyde dehydrogenase family protein [Embleya hyalina]GCD96996.1 aldehyde dehydrogenase [Embleya hyalina]
MSLLAKADTALGTVIPKLHIDGAWTDAVSGRTFAVVDPSTGREIARVAEGDAPDVDLAVRAARRAFESGPWSRMTPADRSRVVWRIGDLLEEHAEEFALLETIDVGKPITASRAADVPLSADYFRYMAGWATRMGGSTVDISQPGEWHAFTLREPIGVVGQIIPWNFPLLMAAWKLAPALVTGNTVVLKPAEDTPLTALRLAAICELAGVPAGVVNVVTGFGPTAGAALAAHPGVDKIAFTGSTGVGKRVVEAAVGNLKKVSLELGGKSPNIIFPDADLDQAILGASQGIFYNAGEACTAGSRLYVHHRVLDRVLDGVSDFARAIKVGPTLDPETTMGPVVSQRHLDRVLDYLRVGADEGAKTLLGGNRVDTDGFYLDPTVFVDTRPDMRVVREEIFGPVLVAQPFSDLDDIARIANDSPYGLAAGIWTKDLSLAHRMIRRLRAGAVYVNSYNTTDAALPFGGYRQSGWGREHGESALDLYTETKGVSIFLG